MIEIIGSTGCMPCREAKRQLDAKGTTYTYYQLGDDNVRLTDLMSTMRKAGGRTVPAFFVNGEYIGSGLATLSKLEQA